MSILGPRGHVGPLHTTAAYSPPAKDKGITRVRLEADMEAFDKAGGKVELLGVTPLRRKPKKEVVPATKGSTKASDAPGQ